ncbi:MAG: hypothetical protein HKN33_00420 [Pyrinomonadaceae bacterium]|nr:hypothetical protein [Pyrinomonadaceae bacterium]
MIFILICLALSLAGITGLQFFYLAYLDRLDKDQKSRIKELERHCQYLSNQLHIAEAVIAEHAEAKKDGGADEGDGDEVWADVLEEA